MKTIEPKELKAKLDSGEKLTLIDVREENEREICHIGGTLIPLAQVVERRAEIPQDLPVVVYCRSGGRSGRAIEALEAQGFSNLYNLVGGVLRWSDEVDGSVVKY
jgi:adenylyltransferase/sulfurtransferase